MARARTLLQLRTEVRALTDTVADEHTSDAQINVWINQGIAELWRKLVAVSPDRYTIAASPNVSTTAGTPSYALEADFMAIRRVERIDGARRIAIEPFNFTQAPIDNPTATGGGLRTRYRIVGGGIDGSGATIYFDPDPGTNTYAYWYIQAPQLLAVDGSSFDGVAGYEDWVVLYASLRVFIRQQDPEQVGIVAEMNRIEAGITASAMHRDVGHAPTIADVRPRRRRF